MWLLPTPLRAGARGRERSFASEVRRLKLGAGQTFHGETVLAVAKALLQSGVGYLGGYEGAPVSHLMDILSDAYEPLLKPLGIHYESSASEAAAAALLGASIQYPLRGAVTWKSIVGTNVASDALSNLAAAGVTGGALIIVGEDYGEGASVIQERTHAIALKSSIPLIDPRYHMPKVVDLVERAFELSEASHLPVFMTLRIRAAHMTGTFECKDNRAPAFGPDNPMLKPHYDFGRIPLPPSIYEQEQAKFAERLPAARGFIVEHKLNEHFPAIAGSRLGIVTQGGVYGALMRAMHRLGLADAFGKTDISILVLNVVFPLVPEEIGAFLRDKDDVLVVEEGNPPYVEREVAAIAQREGLRCRVRGKDALPMAGEYTTAVMRGGLARWLTQVAPGPVAERVAAHQGAIEEQAALGRKAMGHRVPPRPPGFCTGCPERPVFTALRLLQDEIGPLHLSLDIGCSTFATLPPFNMGNTVLGYGMSLASGGAVGPAMGRPTVAVMGDGGFWHNGVLTGAANARWNRQDAVLIVLENGYASATGQQPVFSTGSNAWGEAVKLSIEATLRAMGVRWIRRVDSYDVDRTLDVLRAAVSRRGRELRVIISDQECMIARQRREKRLKAETERAGKPAFHARFGVDQEVCVGDHACMRLSGCPSLTIKPSADPLKAAPTAYVEEDCVACGLCGANAHAAGLCPSFYKATRWTNPTPWQLLKYRIASGLISLMGAS
jgi:indolepyruvate ferredoxin oxidoreductase alpha subunit